MTGYPIADDDQYLVRSMADGQTYLLFLLVVSILADRVVPYPAVIFAPYTWIGILFIVAGIVLCFLTRPVFIKNRTTLSPYESPTTLLRSGPFLISRNPIYLGMAVILTGTSIFLGSLISFLSPVLFIAIMEIRFIPREELMLEKLYGEEYREYKRNVRKWI
jgi:protein-S-isoprenylcysteine O-methyltransferase Ste14